MTESVKKENTGRLERHERRGGIRMEKGCRQWKGTGEYNRACGVIFQKERKKRKLSLETMASGLLSRTALRKMETGESGWQKLVGDTLFQRMGIWPDYFEILASSEEMERWRLREDICLAVVDRPRETEEKIREYRRKYQNREPLEEQFLRKAELIGLLLKVREENVSGEDTCDEEKLLRMAEETVSCTLSGDWKGDLTAMPAAPSELEAVLLDGWVRMICGRHEEAWKRQSDVWEYPERHKWEERMTVRICPQAALLGMELALQEKDSRKAFRLGQEALELLRRNSCHCYLLPLLEGLERIPGGELWLAEQEYQRQAVGFRDAFQRIYDQFGYPGHRIWQGITVGNTRDVGITLKMLRKYAGKPRSQAVSDEEGIIVTGRQLEKIEKGEHKPSYENYQRLVRQYGKNGSWMEPMLETDSLEVLKLRQEIATLIGFCEWDRAERETERLRGKVNTDYPKVRQELLFFEALKVRRAGELEKGLELLLEALQVTVPDMKNSDKKWWVFQREEIMIASNIAGTLRKLGKMEEAKAWYEIIVFSLEQQSNGTDVKHTGYDMLMEGIDNYLGNMRRFEEAVEANKEAVCNYLKQPQIDTLARALYRIAWDTYEMALEQNAYYEIFRNQWRNAFRTSQALVNFMYDNYLIEFLEKRKEKYLF